ncbi:MAG: synthase subunit epsilon [Hydrocarboniphaga sp.]|uniref:hypothetical protein n=1 Tax=Hydrocarboniphaga sp. TaxID=2033016 RepID=UPI0026105B25|nr:hypothetical protein [Hydrocarboniphaga sp.]MDB5972261.1 synthase subunit epsilon [Hydrocarboniphaga sp.]
MRLRLTSLGDVLVDTEVQSVRAQDASGVFGILPRHADLLTVLDIGVVSWRDADGAQHHCAVRRGVLSVQRGMVSVATREAVVDDDLEHLESTVIAALRSHDEDEIQARVGGHQLELRIARQILHYLNPGRGALT